MWAILSDLHANLAAIDAVLRDLRNRGIGNDRIICLGDLVGYGPDPADCIDLAMHWKVVIRGNHDDATINEAPSFHPPARKAIDWTRDLLKPRLWSMGPARSRWRFLRDLPTTEDLEGALLVHGSPRDPLNEYLLPRLCSDGTAGPTPPIRENFSRMAQHVCFVGHTHEPGVITPNGRFLRPADIDHRYEVSRDAKHIVNVGSVGQPRDRDPRSCYVLWDGKLVQYVRVAYPVATTQERIRKIPDLDPFFAERLAHGK